MVFLLAVLGCSSAPKNVKPVPVSNNIHDTQVRLSHVKAYLLIGNIEKAEQLFQSIAAENLDFQALLVQAELHALKGNSIEAQKVFLSAMSDIQFKLTPNMPSKLGELVDYFCNEKKWPALEGYGKAILNSKIDESLKLNKVTVKNDAFSQIGLCFFYQQKWDDTKYWLELVDLTKQVDPRVYLALARAYIEQEPFETAKPLILRYEQKKQTVDAQSMWTSIEVYLALKQADMVTKVGENMRSLFSFNQYTSKYILLTKRGRIQAIINAPTPSQLVTNATNATNANLPTTPKIKQSESTVHIIKKGETLYQLSKRYAVSIDDLLKWNPDLVVDDIALGTAIKVKSQ